MQVARAMSFYYLQEWLYEFNERNFDLEKLFDLLEKFDCVRNYSRRSPPDEDKEYWSDTHQRIWDYRES